MAHNPPYRGWNWTSALESAAQQSEMLDAVNNYYSATVVERAKVKGVFATHDYADHKDMIPLPCNPESISIGYGLRNGEKVLPLTSLMRRVSPEPVVLAMRARRPPR